ncbi:MAG: heat-shock protein [Pseudomonadales bacterium]|nr:heat-shock protein [Pseudomonadales bacterium]RLU02782.1 MAG: Hsp20/alpha crystallin family protein [Ketobacter sp.]
MSTSKHLSNSPRGFDSFQQLVDNFFGRSSGGFPAFANETFNMPATDISENETEYTISAELPGIRKEDIDVSLHDGVLSIEAHSKSEHEEKGDKQIRSERRYGKFIRRFTLGENADESAVQAKFEDGVLKLVVKKTSPQETPKPKAIPIS